MGMKTENQNLDEAVKRKEEERKLFESKNNELLDKNEKLVKQMSV